MKKFLLATLCAIYFTCPALAMNAVETRILKDYNKGLEELNSYDYKSATKALKLYTVMVARKDSQELKDAAFLAYFDFYCDNANSIEIKNQTQVENDWDKYQKFYNNYGYSLYGTDGYTGLKVNYEFLNEKFKDYVSKDWISYLNFNQKFDEVVDPSWVNNYDDLRLLIIQIEDIAKNTKNDELKQKAQDYFIMCINSYVGSSELDYSYTEDGTVKKEVLDSYKVFLKKNKKSKSYKVVKACYDYLKKNKFVADYKYRQFVQNLIEDGNSYNKSLLF